MRCGIGFHPGFNIPFDETTQLRIMRFGLSKRKAQSFWIVFLMVCSLEKFLSMENTQVIPLTDTLFDNDSFCLAGLRSKTIGIYEKNSERKSSAIFRNIRIRYFGVHLRNLCDLSALSRGRVSQLQRLTPPSGMNMRQRLASLPMKATL